MNIKEILKEIYPIDQYKKLKEENFVLFSLTILIPLSLLFLFFYLYFYPFGYSKEYTITQENILEEQGDISFSQGEGKTNGLLHITVDPKIRVRNLFGEVTVKGEDVHILHPNIEGEEMLDVWEYETDSFNVEDLFPEKETVLSESEEGEEQKEVDFGQYKYSVLDEYNIRDSNILSFYLRWEPLAEEVPVGNQLLLKYKNLRIIQHPGSIELRVDEVYDGNMYTYQIPAGIDYRIENGEEDGENEEHSNENELIAIYSKPNNSLNGYIELVVNSVRIGRVVVSSPYNLFSDYDDLKQYEEPLNQELVKDLNQEKISLGQDLYRVNIEESFPEDLVDAINLDAYYNEKYKTPLLKEKEQSSPLTLSEYYPKPFYNYFKGNIYELRVGYEYPFEKIQNHSRFYGHTPFTFSIAGQTEDIEEITFITTRDPIWKNLMSF
jgi:hypothetical protein